MSQRYFLITGSDEICEVVEQSQLLKAVHDMFCCCDVATCDNCYLEAFKEEFKDGVDFEGWKESLEDGWLNVEELPAKPHFRNPEPSMTPTPIPPIPEDQELNWPERQIHTLDMHKDCRERIAKLTAEVERLTKTNSLLQECQANHNWWVKRAGELEAENTRLKALGWAVLEDDDCDACDGDCDNPTCAYFQLRQAIAAIKEGQ